jgi:transposase InsO family protein
LQNQDNYSLQKHEFEEYEADLADVTSFSQQNDGIQFLLIVIDLFSRYLHVRPLKNKTSNIVLEAFQDIFNNTIKPKKIRTDKGKEFCNNLLEQYLKPEGIYHHIARNQTKANYAERCIKTLQGMLYRYFTKKRTYRYIDVLQIFVSIYNATLTDP